MARWSEALDAQTSLIRAARTREYQDYIEGWIQAAEEGLSLDPKTSLESQAFSKRRGVAREIAAMSQDSLGGAEPIYVSAQITELITVAASTMKPEPLLKSDYFTNSGFAYFEQPIATSGGLIKALQWNVEENGRTFVDIIGYVGASRIGGSDLRLAFYYRTPTGETLETFGTEWQTLQAFWRLAQQQIIVANAETPDRASRHRARPRRIETVVVFTLRRVKHKSNETREVDWSYSWFVNGHWRNQWYPSLGTHRQIWIGMYLKQRDKPLVTKTHITAFVR